MTELSKPARDWTTGNAPRDVSRQTPKAQELPKTLRRAQEVHVSKSDNKTWLHGVTTFSWKWGPQFCPRRPTTSQTSQVSPRSAQDPPELSAQDAHVSVLDSVPLSETSPNLPKKRPGRPKRAQGAQIPALDSVGGALTTLLSLPNYQATELPSYHVTTSPSYRVAKVLGY
jgi:hypothetical protein